MPSHARVARASKNPARQHREKCARLHPTLKLRDIALVMTGASAIVGFVGVGFLLSGKASEGTVTTAGGLVSSMVFTQLAKDASDRLDKANERLDRIATKFQNEVEFQNGQTRVAGKEIDIAPTDDGAVHRR